MDKVCKGASADQQGKSKSAGKRRTELTARVEEQTSPHSLEPSGWSAILLFAKQNSKLLIEVS
jgi:hypothetical protein